VLPRREVASVTKAVLIGDATRSYWFIGVRPRNGLFQILSVLTFVAIASGAQTTTQELFDSASFIPVGASPWQVAVGDFNRDGVQDLAVADSGGG
jgi:hypothetical protein